MFTLWLPRISSQVSSRLPSWNMGWTREEKRRNESVRIEEQRRQGRSHLETRDFGKIRLITNKDSLKAYASKVNRTKPSKSTRIIMMRSFKIPRSYKARLVKATISSTISLSETAPSNLVTNVDKVKAGKSNKSFLVSCRPASAGL